MNELTQMLAAPDKKIYEAKGILAKLYRLILMECNVTSTQMNGLMNKWLDDPRNQIPQNGKTRSSERGNMIKEVSREDMTWKVFLKGLRLLRPIKISFEIKLHWRKDEYTIHTLSILERDMNLDVEPDD